MSARKKDDRRDVIADRFDAYYAAQHSEGDIDFATLNELRDGADVGEVVDCPCPLCGPDRETEYGQDRTVLRIWENEAGFYSYYCARCEAKGYAQAGTQQLLRKRKKKKKPLRRDDISQTMQYVERLWRDATPDLPPMAVAYFRWRGINLDTVPRGALRFHWSCPWQGEHKPCIVARYSDPLTGELKGIWRRCIDVPNIPGLKFKPMTLGPQGGCVIRLWPEVSDRLVIAEGIETALAAATRIKHRGRLLRPVWATGCAGNMRRFPVIDGIERLIILADNDVSGTGHKVAAECARRWMDAGRKVDVLMPETVGFDFNDLVKP